LFDQSLKSVEICLIQCCLGFVFFLDSVEILITKIAELILALKLNWVGWVVYVLWHSLNEKFLWHWNLICHHINYLIKFMLP